MASVVRSTWFLPVSTEGGDFETHGAEFELPPPDFERFGKFLVGGGIFQNLSKSFKILCFPMDRGWGPPDFERC